MHPSLPSPPPSSHRSDSIEPSHLPQTRVHPLKPGSAKESSVIYYLDDRLLAISRRYEKRIEERALNNEPSRAEDRSHGYRTFGQLAQEIEAVIDVVWVTASRKTALPSVSRSLTSVAASLQVSYLLAIALSVCTYMPSFPFSPRPTFHLLDKLDLAFSSLLQGSNAETGERLPGFEGLLGARGIDTTKKVRMKGIVERTRTAVVEVAAMHESSLDGMSSQQAQETDDETTKEDGSDSDGGILIDRDRGNWDMRVATVYEKTIMLLGESLDLPVHGEPA